ncbi:hypothetical protein GQX73_g8513 [Xylaria multiplex]|uniref:Uncharacterized protein n=1 Tax=Xylaria multiplex TaxID=323545 RepID=A0A7C8MT90_9PEZI|nr:hypothetical protein GQX73_g8513 [Xylaria multiplex]
MASSRYFLFYESTLEMRIWIWPEESYLELPHIPHLTTITSSIVPTEKLSLWRLEHADRYRFVLSDSSPSTKRDYIDPSCVRNKKTWLIDHTLFVSTRSEGTRPVRSPNPKEFHEMQWDPYYGATGRLVEEREFPITSLDQSSEVSPPETADTFASPDSRSQRLRHSLSSISIIEKFIEKLGKHKKEPEVEQRRRSWIPNSLLFDPSPLFRDKRTHCGALSVPWPEGCQIPNAIFARKFLIVDDGETLPSHLPISQMPTAESKATDTIIEAATIGLLNQASSWLFRGPFTPQLGFDGGLDYQWSPQDPGVIEMRFNWELSLPGTPSFDPNRSPRDTRLLGYDTRVKSHESSSKRRGRVFDFEGGAKMKARASRHDSLNNTSPSKVREKILEDNSPISPLYISKKAAKSVDETSSILKKFAQKRHEQNDVDTQLFDNIEFTTQAEPHDAYNPVTNRQTAVIERPSQGETGEDGVWNPLMFPDPEQEKIMRALQAPSEICAEENEARIANRRFSDILPLHRPTFLARECNSEDSSAIHSGHGDHTPPRIVSAPLSREVNSCLSNTTIAPPHLHDKQSTPNVLSSCILPSSSGNLSPDSGVAGSTTLQYPNTDINITVDEVPCVMTGANTPIPPPKFDPCHPPASHSQGITPETPSSNFSREGSASSLVSLGARDSSIRIVKPDLTLSPPHRSKDKDSKKSATDYSTPSRVGKNKPNIMRGNGQNSQNGPSKAGGSQSRSKVTSEHSRSQSQHTQSFNTAGGHDPSRGYSATSLTSKPDPPTQKDSVQANSTDRGRTMQRRYEFIDSDDKIYTGLSPVQETSKKRNDGINSKGSNNTGRDSNMTTVTNLMQQCMEQSPPKLPVHRTHLQHQAKGGIGSAVTQPSLPQPKGKHRPLPLNLTNPAYIGVVRGHTDRYQIEHNEIKSSKAEYFNSSFIHDCVEDSPRIAPLNIPENNVINSVNFLQSYSEWRQNLKPVRTASQGTIHISIPTREEDTFMGRRESDGDRLPIMDYPTAQNTPVINHMRSRSALGIRENRDKADRHRQFSGDSVYASSEYSTVTPFSQGPGVARSATMNEVSHRDRQFSRSSESKASQNGAMINESVPKTEARSVSPFTPLTPFIMRANGAPAGVEKGSKTLFGEHGWLEDTATSAAKNPKPEKTGGFMESLKRKAREIADSTSFKPARNIRTTAVNHVSISLDAREQSLLYCELEYNLNNALDSYFKAQLNSGRLEASKLSRVADAWAQKGRPKVIGFRYDLETQVDLITAHANDFRFYGPVQAEGPAAVAGLLYAMKTNARYMRIRTFCQPDSVIAKHVLDSQSFLRLLGSPESLQRPLEEVAQFFKVAVDRRKAMAEAPARQGGGRFVSDGSGRVTSNGSGQRVRFQDDSERRRPYAEMPGPSKSRSDVRGRSDGNKNPQVVKSQSENRGFNKQR